ncbi:MAG: HD domain-containing protein [Lachnospiraceae bacterium]
MQDKLLLEMLTYYAGDPMRAQHFIKVHAFARLIGSCEGLDEKTMHILEASAYVHDIGIKKAEELYASSNGKLQEELGPKIACEMLEGLGYESGVIDRICYLVGHHHTYSDIDGLDYQILVEADFLVNLYEDNVGKEPSTRAIVHTYDTIFKTETGRRLCAEMFGLKI